MLTCGKHRLLPYMSYMNLLDSISIAPDLDLIYTQHGLTKDLTTKLRVTGGHSIATSTPD